MSTQNEPTEPTFYQRISIPLNLEWRENGYDFINPVTVAEMFAEATGLAALLAQEAEDLTGEMANYQHLIDEGAGKELQNLRRRLLASHWSGVKSSWNVELTDAFVLAMAIQDGCTQLLTVLENEVSEFERQIALRKPRLTRIKERLRVLGNNMEYAKQYLDYEKLQARAAMQGRA